MAAPKMSGLSVGVQHDAANGRYVFGVELGDTFLPFYAVPVGHIAEQIAAAAEPPKPKPKTPASK